MMKQCLLAVSLVALLAVAGFLGGCSSDSEGITQSANITGSQAISEGEGASADSQDGRPAGPPPEAFEACAGKSEGDTADLTTPDGETVSGTCQSLEGELVLVLEDGQRPSQPDREPPQEAFDVCEGKTEGTSAELTTPDGGLVTGTCQTIEDQLVLVPENGRPGGPPPNTE